MGSWLKETYTISSYSRGYRIKYQKKSEKNAVYFQSEDNHETIIAKRGKVLRNYRFKHAFSFKFLRETEEVETLGKKWWGKQSNLATSRGDLREAHTILAS